LLQVLWGGNFKYTVRNTGNTYQNFTGTIISDGWFTDPKINSTGEVYPRDKYDDVVTWKPGLWDLRVYNAKCKIEYGRYNPQKPLEGPRPGHSNTRMAYNTSDLVNCHENPQRVKNTHKNQNIKRINLFGQFCYKRRKYFAFQYKIISASKIE